MYFLKTFKYLKYIIYDLIFFCKFVNNENRRSGLYIAYILF